MSELADTIIIHTLLGVIFVGAAAIGIVCFVVLYEWFCGDLIRRRHQLQNEKAPSE